MAMMLMLTSVCLVLYWIETMFRIENQLGVFANKYEECATTQVLIECFSNVDSLATLL